MADNQQFNDGLDRFLCPKHVVTYTVVQGAVLRPEVFENCSLILENFLTNMWFYMGLRRFLQKVNSSLEFGIIILRLWFRALGVWAIDKVWGQIC